MQWKNSTAFQMIHKTFSLTYYWNQSILQIQAIWDKDWQKLVIKSDMEKWLFLQMIFWS